MYQRLRGLWTAPYLFLAVLQQRASILHEDGSCSSPLMDAAVVVLEAAVVQYRLDVVFQEDMVL